MLDLTGMLKATIHDGSQNLRLQQEIPESAAVDGDVVTLDGALFLSLNSIFSSISLNMKFCEL